MYADTNLYNALNVSNITDLLTDSSYIFNDALVPQEIGAQATTINFYRLGPYFELEYREYNYTVNCRGKDYNTSNTLAHTVKDEIHRWSSSDNSYYITVEVLQTINAADNTDNYNTPLEITIKERG